jgi:hypothetical protein
VRKARGVVLIFIQSNKNYEFLSEQKHKHNQKHRMSGKSIGEALGHQSQTTNAKANTIIPFFIKDPIAGRPDPRANTSFIIFPIKYFIFKVANLIEQKAPVTI